MVDSASASRRWLNVLLHGPFGRIGDPSPSAIDGAIHVWCRLLTSSGFLCGSFGLGTNPAARASSWNIFTSSEYVSRLQPTFASFFQNVVCDGDDVATNRIGLEDIEQFPRACPNQLGQRRS